jgi:hypothetical protein
MIPYTDNLFFYSIVLCVLPSIGIQVETNMYRAGFMTTVCFLAIILCGMAMYATNVKYNTDGVLWIPMGCFNWILFLYQSHTDEQFHYRLCMISILCASMQIVLFMKRYIDQFSPQMKN